MRGAHEFLVALTAVLGVAAVTTVVFQRLRQPVVLGYILAGLIVGPHVPVPLVANVGVVQTLSELGVIMLMFSLGLEFSVRRLVQVGPTAGITALVQCSIMLWIGFVAGRLFGWRPLESVFAGAVIAISSTTIIAKVFDDLGIRGKVRELVVGVLIVEDLIAILLMAMLTALAKGSGLSASALALTVGRLVLFLVVLVAIGMVIVPRTIRWIRRIDRPETTLVATLGICFGVALLAFEVGYSVALGAFIAGSLVAESGEEKHVEQLVQPVRDMFAAIFFVSVGMTIDPAVIGRHGWEVAALTGLVIVGKLGSVTFGAFLSGQGTRTSVAAGMSLAQIGEFSFIIAGLGVSLGATREFLYPIAVAVSGITTLTTPWLVRAAGPVASWVDHALPRPLQTVATLYGSWLERLRTSPSRERTAPAVRRIVRVLVVDAALIAVIVIGTSLALDPATRAALELRPGVDPDVARLGLVGVACLVSIPFSAGILRNARRLAVTLAAAALPEHVEGRADLAEAPRRALIVTLQLATVILAGVPVLAVTQPFLRGAPGVAVLGAVLAVLGFAFWRSAANLQGHVRAGAQVIVEALARQAAPGPQQPDALAPLQDLLPGLGEPVSVRLDPASPVVGRTLAGIDLRGRTGATVLAIWRSEGAVMVPNAEEVLRAGDVLALAGAHEAVAAATELLMASRAEGGTFSSTA
jgi:CPA2 family monovalent cation:H+ antiporter-2